MNIGDIVEAKDITSDWHGRRGKVVKINTVSNIVWVNFSGDIPIFFDHELRIIEAASMPMFSEGEFNKLLAKPLDNWR